MVPSAPVCLSEEIPSEDILLEDKNDTHSSTFFLSNFVEAQLLMMCKLTIKTDEAKVYNGIFFLCFYSLLCKQEFQFCLPIFFPPYLFYISKRISIHT